MKPTLNEDLRVLEVWLFQRHRAYCMKKMDRKGRVKHPDAPCLCDEPRQALSRIKHHVEGHLEATPPGTSVREALLAFSGAVDSLPQLSKSPYAKPSIRSATFDALDSLESDLAHYREALERIAGFVCLEAGLDGVPACGPVSPRQGCHTCVARQALGWDK